MADGAPQRLAELWYGVEVSATNSTRRSLPPLGLVSKPYCLTSLSNLKSSYLLDCDVDDSVQLSSTSEAVPYEL